jgi:hypothetical protein
LDWIVRKMLAKQPTNRFQTAGELSDVLRWMKRQLEPGSTIARSSGEDLGTLHLTDEQASRATLVDIEDELSGERRSSGGTNASIDR